MAIEHGYPSLVKQALTSYASLLAKCPSPFYDIILAFDDVPREDIVLGFQAPIMRPYTEFAVE
ncbi:MAG: element excision factor XisI family protein [Pseudomonadota bacterium]